MDGGDVLDDGTLGSCPVCHRDIEGDSIVIKYERGERQTTFARCEGCRQVVRPR